MVNLCKYLEYEEGGIITPASILRSLINLIMLSGVIICGILCAFEIGYQVLLTFSLTTVPTILVILIGFAMMILMIFIVAMASAIKEVHPSVSISIVTIALLFALFCTNSAAVVFGWLIVFIYVMAFLSMINSRLNDFDILDDIVHYPLYICKKRTEENGSSSNKSIRTEETINGNDNSR